MKKRATKKARFFSRRKRRRRSRRKTRKKRGGGWITVSDGKVDTNLETTVETLRQMIEEQQRVRISSEHVYSFGGTGRPYEGTVNRVWVVDPAEDDPSVIGLVVPEYYIPYAGQPNRAPCGYGGPHAGEYFRRPIKIERWERPKRPKSARKTGKKKKKSRATPSLPFWPITVVGAQNGGRRKTRKKRGRGANKKLLAKRRTRKKRKARTCVCGQVWGKNWLQCSKCGREWRDEGAPLFARTKIEFEKNSVYKKWERKALKNPRRKSDHVEAPSSSSEDEVNSTTNEDEYYDPAAAWNTNDDSLSSRPWQSNDSGDPFEKGNNSHLRRYVYGYKHGGGRRPPPPTPHPVDAHGRRVLGVGATAPNKIVVLTMNGQKIEILLDPRTWGEGVSRGGLGPNNIPNQDSVVPFAARDPTAFDEVGSWYKPKWNSEITEAHSIGVLFDLIADKLKKLDDQPIGGFKTEEEGMLPGSLLSIVKRARPTPRSRYDFLDLRPPQRMAVHPRWRLQKQAIWQHLDGGGLNLLDGEPIYVMIRDPVRLRAALAERGGPPFPPPRHRLLMLMRYLGRLIRHRPARGPRASAARNEWADKYDEEANRIADVAHNQGAPPRRVQIAAVAAHYDELAAMPRNPTAVQGAAPR